MPGESDVARSKAALEDEMPPAPHPFLAPNTSGDAVDAGSESTPADPDEDPSFVSAASDLDPGHSEPPVADADRSESTDPTPADPISAGQAEANGSRAITEGLAANPSDTAVSEPDEGPAVYQEVAEPQEVPDTPPAADSDTPAASAPAIEDLPAGPAGNQDPSAAVAAVATESATPEPATRKPATTEPIAEPPAPPAPPPVATAAETAPAEGLVPGMPPALPEGAEAEADADVPEVPDYDAQMDETADRSWLRTGEIRRGQVVSITDTGVIVDIGSKTEGVAPLDDFRDDAGELRVKVGDEIDVLVEAVGAGEYASLSHRRAKQSKIWEGLEQASRNQQPVQAKIVSKVKGGLSADVGVLAFLPGSQVDLRPVADLDSLIGEDLPVRIVKINRKRGNVVVSRRALLEEARERLKQETLSKLTEGGEITGTVKNVTDYGAFVDLGGLDGLIHVTDISYGRIRSPSDVLRPGQEVTAKVLKFHSAKDRVSLSLKHMHPDPWAHVEEHFLAGKKVTGRVTSLSDYGVFVELEPGVEGLIHLTELTWARHRPHPSKVYSIGDEIEAVVLKVKRKERRISLSAKRLRPNPWSNPSERYQTGTVVEGRVGNLTSYGAFVEVEEGVDGLIHVSDLSWTKRVNHPKEVLKKGDRVRAVVLQVDSEKHRIALGLKQLEPDVWETFLSQYAPGDVLSGLVCRRTKFGVFVELVPGVEGLCHQSEMKRASKKKGKEGLEVGRQYPFRIIKLDEFDKKIALSRRDVEDKPKGAEPGVNSVPRMKPAGQVLAQPAELSAEPAPLP